MRKENNKKTTNNIEGENNMKNINQDIIKKETEIKINAAENMKGNDNMKRIIEDIMEEGFIGTILEKRGYEEVDIDDELAYMEDFFIGIYIKGEKYYGMIELNYFNTLIYDAELIEVDSLSDLYNYVIESKSAEIEEELINNEFTLDELESECLGLIGYNCESIYDYDRFSVFGEDGDVGDEGSFSWGKFNVCFVVLRAAEDMEDILIKVDSIEIVDI